MADLTGRFVRCQIGGPSSTWLPILGERSTRISTERSPIDCTTRTEVWSTAIGGGVGSRSITVGGVARKGAGWSAIMAAQWAGTAVPLRFLDVTDVVYEGSGLVTKMNQDMAHDGAQIFSVEFILGPAIYDGYITSTYTSTWTGSVWGTPVITGSTVVATLPVGINTWVVVDIVAIGTFTTAAGTGDFNGWLVGFPPNPVPALPNLLPAPYAPVSCVAPVTQTLTVNVEFTDGAFSYRDGAYVLTPWSSSLWRYTEGTPGTVGFFRLDLGSNNSWDVLIRDATEYLENTGTQAALCPALGTRYAKSGQVKAVSGGAVLRGPFAIYHTIVATA